MKKLNSFFFSWYLFQTIQIWTFLFLSSFSSDYPLFVKTEMKIVKQLIYKAVEDVSEY